MSESGMSPPAGMVQEDSSQTDCSESERNEESEKSSAHESPMVQKDGCINSQMDHTDSEDTINKENDSSPLAGICTLQKRSSFTHSTSQSIAGISKEPELTKAKLGDEPIDIEFFQTNTNKPTVSNLHHVNKKLSMTKIEYDTSSNETKILCYKPGKLRATDITNGCIEIEWTKPEQNAGNITSYTILYHSASDPSDHWREKEASEERAIISGLTENNLYCFKVQSVYDTGLKSDESDISNQITMETPTQENLCNKAWKARTKWENIGLQLGLMEDDLDAIKRDNHDRSEDCFREIIKKWLLQTGGSWRKLIAALNHETVGYCVLAISIAASLGLPQPHKITLSDDHGKFITASY